LPEIALSVNVKSVEKNVFLNARLNVTEIVQCAPAAREVGQALACVKSAVFGPVIAIFVIFNAVVPVFVRVTVFVLVLFTGFVPKLRLSGSKSA
jgi:hypothetical protein